VGPTGPGGPTGPAGPNNIQTLTFTVSSTDRAKIEYNTTSNSIDFIFLT
jgi:hypothetical protein